MTIGIDASRAAKKIKTGTEWYSFFLIEELKKITGEHRVILYSREPLEGALGNMPVNWENRVLKWLPKYLWTQIRLSMEMFFNPPDVLFIPAHSLPLIHPKNSVVTWHDIGFEQFKHLYGKAEYWYHKWAVRFSLQHASKIIVISKFTRDEILEVFGKKGVDAKITTTTSFRQAQGSVLVRSGNKILTDKIAVVYNGYDNKKYRSNLDKNKIREVLKKYNIDAPYIFFVGRLEEKKNIRGLVTAFAEFKKALKCEYSAEELSKDKISNFKFQIANQIQNFNEQNSKMQVLKLVLAGRRGYGFDKVKEIIGKYEFQDDIVELGWTDENDIPYLIAGSSIFAFLSFYEGFGIPILEAMACGAPVIASDIQPLREVAGDAAIFVNPNDSNKIAENMAKILEDNDLRERMVKRGLERVKDFSWEKCAMETWEEIKKLRY